MVRRFALACAVGLCLAVQCALAAPGDKPVIPPELPPFPCTNQQAEQYWKDANRFLQEHGDSPHAPSVQHGLVMLAHLGGREDKLREQQHILLLRFPRSVPAAHIAGSFSSPAEFRNVLRLKVDESPAVLASRTYSAAFCAAADLGIAKWGAERFLEDDNFMLESAVAARVSHHKSADQFANFARAKGKFPTRQVVEVFFDPLLSHADKLEALLELDETAPTAVCHEVLWDRLSKEDRGELTALRARADHLCRQGQIAAAGALLAEATHDDPQLLFIRLWCAACVGDEKGSRTALDSLKKNHYESEWQRRGEELWRLSDGLKKKRDAQLLLWEKVAADLQKSPMGVEAWINSVPAQKSPPWYLAVCPSESLFEIHVQHHGQPIMAYQAAPMTTKLYFAEDDKTTELPSSGTFPVIRWTKTEDDRPFNRRQIGLRWDLSNADAFEASARKLAEFPYLRSPETIAKTFDAAIAAGYLPSGVYHGEKTKTATWVRPNPRTGELLKWRADFDAAGRIRSISTPTLTFGSINYLGDANWRKQSPMWPDAPIQRAEFDAAAMGKLLGAMVKFFESMTADKAKQEAVAGGGPAAK